MSGSVQQQLNTFQITAIIQGTFQTSFHQFTILLLLSNQYFFYILQYENLITYLWLYTEFPKKLPPMVGPLLV